VNPTHPPRFRAEDLRAFATTLMCARKLPSDRAAAVADILVEADLLGHFTHGLGLLPTYLRDIDSGAMRLEGEPIVVSDKGAAIVLDGCRLPGAWLVLRAFDLAAERVRAYGTATVAIRRSYHIGCLAAYLQRATERGLVMLLHSSAPDAATVAPFGGVEPVFTPDPISVGYPTRSDPVMIDVSTSVTSNNFVNRMRAEGRRLPHAWLLDENGEPSDDPAVLVAPRRGSVQPLGGLDAGHKGYGLALMVEALTSGLAGHGRADPDKLSMGASVFLQLLDPEAFGGLAAFTRETEWTANACRRSRPRPGRDPVRLPGEGGLRRKREQLANGVVLARTVIDALAGWAERVAVTMPAPMTATPG
jgi:LDH2 family malate/lactate/ureidoglycolate dehydrogenase